MANYISGAWKLKGEQGTTIPNGVDLTQEVNFKYYHPDTLTWVDSYKIGISPAPSSEGIEFCSIIRGYTNEDDNYCICEGPGWDNVSSSGPILDFGNTEQEVNKEFYDLMQEHAYLVNVDDYFKSISGKYKWNDSLPVVDYFEWRPKKVGDYELNHIDYYVTSGVLDGIFAFVLLKQNNEGTSYEQVGIYVNYPGVLDAWLDGSVTVEQFYQGVPPVPSDIYQTWEFEENTVLPVLEYNYLMTNATKTEDTSDSSASVAVEYNGQTIATLDKNGQFVILKCKDLTFEDDVKISLKVELESYDGTVEITGGGGA